MWYQYQKILDGKVTYLDNDGWFEADGENAPEKMRQMLEHKDSLDIDFQKRIDAQKQKQVYAVTAEYRGGFCSFVGFATGEIEDIRAHFDKGYPLSITPTEVIHVEGGFAEKRRQLLIRQEQLQIELEQIRQQLREMK